MNRLATLDGKVYHLTAVNKENSLGLYKSNNEYLVATDNKRVILHFNTTIEEAAMQAASRLGYAKVHGN